jgi:hypothetical protein
MEMHPLLVPEHYKKKTAISMRPEVKAITGEVRI